MKKTNEGKRRSAAQKGPPSRARKGAIYLNLALLRCASISGKVYWE
jgi:hypothetical protein